MRKMELFWGYVFSGGTVAASQVANSDTFASATVLTIPLNQAALIIGMCGTVILVLLQVFAYHANKRDRSAQRADRLEQIAERKEQIKYDKTQRSK